MIIKLLQDEVIDGKLRVKGEVVRVRNFDDDCVVIKKEKVKKLKLKKNGKVK